jgi:4-hydroxy-tetrahydrodipicolinate synthase
MITQIRGVFCAAATPIGEDGTPDLGRMAEHARQLIADGCDGVALLGTTGEANSFSLAERQNIVEGVVAAGIAPDRLMPGTGTSAIGDTVALTRHSLSLGVTRFVMLPPFYYKQPSDDGLFAAYSEVIERVADPRLRIVLYHIPPISMIPLSLALIERLVARYPQIVVGVKDSSGEYANMEAMVRALPGFSVLVGADPLMRPLLAIGGAGCITAASNLAAQELVIIYRHHGDPERKAEVDAAQERITKLRAVSAKFVQIPAIKGMLARRYKDDAWRRVRPPLTPLDEAQIGALDRMMDEIGWGRRRPMPVPAVNDIVAEQRAGPS